MGMFKKKYAGQEASSNALNAFLGTGTEYRGRLEFTGTVRIDGEFEGEIVADGSLVLGREAVITGRVTVGTLVSNGQIQGDVVVTSKAILQKSSALSGSLRTGALVVEEGAIIEGSVEMAGRDPSRKGYAMPELGKARKAAALDAAKPAEADGGEAAELPGGVAEEEPDAEPVRASRIS